MPTTFLHIPPRKIVGNDGQVVDVGEFQIAREPVTVQEFAEFCEATGYVSEAERRGDSHYASNDISDDVPWEEYRTFAAPFMALEDALAYCSFRGARLPTDSEWVAAAVLDWARTYKGKDRVAAARMVMNSPEAIQDVGLEWVFDEASSTFHLRSAPVYVLREDWESRSQPFKAGPGFYAHTSRIRIARDA